MMHDLAAKMGWMFHHGERMNREITLLAAFRLEMEKNGGDEEAAAKYAMWANERAHFNYDPADAARIFRGWPAQMAMQFKKYPRAMLYLWAKSSVDMIKGLKKDSSPETQKAGREAAATLGGLFFMQVAFAGAFGLPMMGVIAGIMNIIGSALDDDPDLPFDIEKESRLKLAEWGGDAFATAIVKGAFNAATPLNLSPRMSMENPFFRPADDDLAGKDVYLHYAGEALGPGLGIAARLLISFDDLKKGELLRAAEQALPKAAADPIKAYRYATENAQTLHHELIKDMTPQEVFMQMLGFGSSDLELKQTMKGYAKYEEKMLGEKRQSLVNQYILAKEQGNELPTEEITEWNYNHPYWKIEKSQLVSSMRTRKKHEKTIEDVGFSVNPKLKYLNTKYGSRD